MMGLDLLIRPRCEVYNLIRLSSLNWCCTNTQTHTLSHTLVHKHPPTSPGQPVLPEWSMSLSWRSVSRAPGGPAEPPRLGSRLTLADTGWVMSACSSQGPRGRRGSGSVWSSGLGERSVLSLLWLIRQQAECPQRHYQYLCPLAARPAIEPETRSGKRSINAVIGINSLSVLGWS